MSISKKFADKMKELRLYKGYTTQAGAAQALGISRSRYHEYESGKRKPSLDTIERVCLTFEMDMNFFIKNGNPLDYDLNPPSPPKSYSLGFSETSVSRFVFSVCRHARKKMLKILLNVYYKSGLSFSIKEYKTLNPGCIIIDAFRKLQHPGKAGIPLFIIDHAEYPNRENLYSFLDEIGKMNSGIIVISREPVALDYFDQEFYVHGLSISDIHKIVLKNFPFLENLPVADKIIKNKIMNTITSCVYDGMFKLENLKKMFTENQFCHFSIYNLFSKLNDIIGKEKFT